MESKLFRDPIHQFIEVSGCALDIINHPLFQRLRRIKQLAFSDFVYHGAEHSRFGHSLGVYHLARRISEKFIESKDKEIKEEFCLAALLHDIGHHPYSHSFEKVLRNNYGADFSDHEEYTVSIIKNTEIGNIIEDNGLSKDNVWRLIKGWYAERGDLQYLNYLISSEFDIDRLDYLLRDSYYCGVTYGLCDLERLLYYLVPIEDTVVISDKALNAVEVYVLARFYMYTQVYMHKTTRAFDIMLNGLFNQKLLDELNYPSNDASKISDFVYYDDCWLRNMLMKLSRDKSFNLNFLSEMILSRNPIRCVIEKSIFTERADVEEHPDYTTIKNLYPTKKLLAERAKIEESDIFFDEPWDELPIDSKYRPYLSFGEIDSEGNGIGDQSDKAIKIKTRTGSIDIASLPNSIAYRIARQQAKVIRMYTYPHLRKQLGEATIEIAPTVSHLVWIEKI